jgi:RimJ/RimL family protein N-acetyltransferase
MSVLALPIVGRAIEVSSPFPPDKFHLVWQWMNEFPSANFDDYGPQDFRAFLSEMRIRMKVEKTWAISSRQDRLCGIVAYLPITSRMGTFHGICFAKGCCTREEKRDALRLILKDIFDSGVEKVCASYFADNFKIDRFLTDLGAVRESYFRRHTLRNGVPLDMIQVAIFRGEN